MPAATSDHHTLARLVKADAVSGTHVVGKPGGWGVIVKCGCLQSPLAATRSKEIRVCKRLETLVGYLKGIGIDRFDVDAADFDEASLKTYSRPDTSATLKQAHAALVHERWFQEQVGQAVKEAEDPATQWVPNKDVMAQSAKRRAAWRAGGATDKAPGDGV